MRKPTTGEPYAGEPHVRFGGRGGESLSYPYQTWDTTSRLVVESAIACHTGKQQRIFSILAAPGENPSQKHLRIQQFARLSKMNSLYDRTGNQFDHIRELDCTPWVRQSN